MYNTESKKRALVVIPRMPFPLNSGGKIAIYDAIKLLSKKYSLTLIIIDDQKTNIKYLDEMRQFSDSLHFFSKNRVWFFINAILGLIKGKPLQVGYFYFSEVQELVNRLSLTSDFFFAFMIRTTSYGLSLPTKKIHYAIDSMYLNYKKSEEKTSSFLWKCIYKIELPLLYKAELEQIEKFDLTTFVNQEEATFWKSKGQVETLPHGVSNTILFYNERSDRYSNVVAFMGKMDYQPNIDAVIWFCKNVAGLLNNDIEFWIIGGYASSHLLNIVSQYKNVKVLGFIDDPYLILRSCICTVAPMQSGGGLQTKILMAMAVESVVVSTSLPIAAIEGAKNGENIIVEDDAIQFANIINDIYYNPLKYRNIKREAKNVIKSTYSLEVIESKLFTFINNYLNI